MPPEIIGFSFHGHLYADLEGRYVLRAGKPLDDPLTRKEFDVLEFFLKRPHELVKRRDVVPLHDHHRGEDDRSADDYRAKINRKLGLQSNELLVLTRGVGFTLNTDVRPVYASDRQEGIEILKASEFNFNFHTLELMRSSLAQSLKVLALNPHGLPQAHITAAYNYINLSQSAYAAELPKTVLPEARDHALQATKHRVTAAAGHGVLALLHLVYDYDWRKAQAEFSIALSLDPDEPATLLSYAHFLVACGKFQDGIEAVERASRLTPDDRIIYASWGWMHLLAGNPEEGIRLCKQALFLHPGFPPAHVMLGWAYEGAGQYDLALDQYGLSLRAEYSSAALSSLGELYGKTDQHDKALAMLAELDKLYERGAIRYVPAYCRALIYAGLKLINECLGELENAYRQRYDWLIHLGLDRRWTPVRDTPRFKRLMTKVGIPYRGMQSCR
jgi:tetratricopeptide (TPR) repeat protein